MSKNKLAIIDLFSGAGGMSFGFHKHPAFRVVGAVDAEIGKPSTGRGKLQCNGTYLRNIGIQPLNLDLSTIAPAKLRERLKISDTFRISVLTCCPPCTGFSRANPENHIRDDRRNSLVRKSADFAIELAADVVVMENARELINGNFRHHYEWFRERLENSGYRVFGRTYMLTKFGLPQVRERAIVIAVKNSFALRTLEDLWYGYCIKEEAMTVERAFGKISENATAADVYPNFQSEVVIKRIKAIPRDGGSWIDLIKRKDAPELLTDSMKRIIEKNRFGSYPDVYGRMAWKKPAPTIKRECCHVGNGRYTHPVEDRLCSVREMASLQGFPDDYVFDEASVSNMYRHIGDAVPPLIAFQISHLCHWILSGKRPQTDEIILPGTNLEFDDILKEDVLEYSIG